MIRYEWAIVISFFLTLNYNNKALYAPSDFTDEENFMKLIADIKEVDSAIEIVKLKNPDMRGDLEKVQKELDKIVIPRANDRQLAIFNIIKKEKSGRS